MTIRDTADLRAHVALATAVELSTIPPYLYAMYSIEDQESDAARLIASVVVEEMLHLCLTANLMTALGGEPDFTSAAMPRYPSLLPHHRPPLTLDLTRCTAELIRDVFMVIERPAAVEAVPEDDEYHTLGQFYRALEMALDELDAETDLFSNHQAERQLSNASFYGPVPFDDPESGGLVLVHDLETAQQALEVIIHQGEGVGTDRWADPGHKELTHYHKFEHLERGTTAIGETWPVLTNPTTDALPERLRGPSDLFNACYRLIFVTLDELFSGRGGQPRLIGRLYGLMSDCLTPTARYLVRQPVGDSATAGPTFERYSLRSKPWAQTARLASTVAKAHPDLEPVAVKLTELATR